MWSWSPTTVTPDGGSISSGETFSPDCIGVSYNVGVATPKLTTYVTCGGENSSAGTFELSSEGYRDCKGVSLAVGLCDIGNGLTVRKGSEEVRDTNLIELEGNLTFAGGYGKALITILSGGDSEVTYATRVDFVDATTMYKGEAAVGTTDNQALWRIAKYVFGSDSDVTVTWASGNDAFDKVWDNRTGYSYS